MTERQTKGLDYMCYIPIPLVDTDMEKYHAYCDIIMKDAIQAGYPIENVKKRFWRNGK